MILRCIATLPISLTEYSKVPSPATYRLSEGLALSWLSTSQPRRHSASRSRSHCGSARISSSSSRLTAVIARHWSWARTVGYEIFNARSKNWFWPVSDCEGPLSRDSFAVGRDRDTPCNIDIDVLGRVRRVQDHHSS